MVTQKVLICPDCKSELERFSYSEDDKNKIGQYKCNGCYTYFRIINESMYNCGKYNILDMELKLLWQ